MLAYLVSATLLALDLSAIICDTERDFWMKALRQKKGVKEQLEDRAESVPNVLIHAVLC